MSRTGKMPISVPEKVDVQINDSIVTVKGPKGELSTPFEPNLVSITLDDGSISVKKKNDSQDAGARQGLYRSLIANLIEGVTNGFSKTLEIKGVGYRAALKGTTLELNLGFSHVVNYPLPEGISVDFQEKSQTVFTISGIDKQLVGQVAAEIRSYRKPEPYKGKGIRYQGEYILRKAGKSIKK